MWEYPASKDCQAVDREMRSMGARKMKAEGQVSWTNSAEIEKAVGEELEKREVLMKEGKLKADRTRSRIWWRRAVSRAIRKELDNREMVVDSDDMEVSPGILMIQQDGVSEVLYVDSSGNYWDEVSGKLLSKDWRNSKNLTNTMCWTSCQCKSVGTSLGKVQSR